MELRDTARGMTSADYKERFRAEYDQLRIRLEKLAVLIRRAEAGALDFGLCCPLDLLKIQYEAMRMYFNVLQKRAAYEKIEVEDLPDNGAKTPGTPDDLSGPSACSPLLRENAVRTEAGTW